MKSALILGNYRPSFVFAKTLSQNGYRVVCGLDGYDRGAEVSRFVDALWDHASFEADPAEFQKDLTAFLARRKNIELVCPLAENFVRAFAQGQLTLPEGTTLISITSDIVNQCLDKPGLLTLAKDLDIPVAPFALTNSCAQVKEQAAKIGFPLVVRPLASTTRLSGKKAVTVNTMDALKTGYDIWRTDNPDLLIQRHVSGKRDNIYFAAFKGRITRYLHAKIVRTDQPDGSGLAVEGETIAPSRTIEAHTRKLVSALNYSGIGCAQYLVDPATNQITFLELNPRIAGNHALPELCGLELGDYLLKTATGKPTDQTLRYGREGLRYSWLAGELDSIKQRQQDKSLKSPDALIAAFHAIKTAIAANADMGFSLSDIKPGIITLCDSLPLIGRLTRKRFKAGIMQKIILHKERLA